VVCPLFFARLIDGDAALFERMRTVVGPNSIWPSDAFFAAKLRKLQ